MKIKRILSVVTMAIAALAAPTAAEAAGDIVDIRVMDQVGKRFGERSKVSGEACSPDNPVVAGEEVCIRVRMLVRNAAATRAGGTPKTWTWFGTGSSSLIRPALGLRIGERNVWAEYSETGAESWQMSGELHYDDAGNETDAYKYFTDFYFKYKVQPGDMGLPVKLLLSSLEPAETSRTSNTYAFRYVNVQTSSADKFEIATEVGGTRLTADLYFADPTSVSVDYPPPYADTYPLRDYNLAKEGLYVKTVDFDKVNGEGGVWQEGQIWRKVYPGMSEAPVTAPAMAIQGGSKASEDIVVYVWSGDESVVIPVGDEIQTIKGSDGVDRKVLTVHIPSGASTQTFALQGIDGVAEGTEADIYMSPTKEVTYNPAGTPTTAYVKRRIAITKAPQPTVQMRFENGETTHDAITADSDYQTAKMQLVFKAVPAASGPVTVRLSATVNGGSSLTALYNENIIRIPNGSGFDIDGKETEVTIPAGETVTRNVFVLGATEATEGGINFKIEKVSGPADTAVETYGHTVTINRAGEEGTSFSKANPAEASVVAIGKGETKTFKFQLSDTYKNYTKTQAGYTGYTFYMQEVETAEVIAQQDGVKQVSNWLNFNAKVDLTPGTYSVEVYALSPDGITTTKRVPYVLQVADSKKVVVTPSTGSFVIGEGEQLPLKLSLNTAHKGDINRFIFLKTVNAGDESLISTTLTKTGALVDKDYKEVTVPQNVQFLDGDKTVTLNAFLANSQTDPTDLTAGYTEGSITVTVTNKPPVLNALTIAGMPVTADDNGTVLADEVPMGVAKTFKITSVNEVAADLNATGDQAFKVKWVIDGIEYVQSGNPIGAVTNHTFTSQTPTGKQGQLVQVFLMDKDMGGVWPAVPNFQCRVKVSAKPYVSIESSAIGGLFNETDSSVGTVTVTLSEPPTEQVEVLLKVQQPATGLFRLRTAEGSVEETATPGEYKLIFNAGTRAKNIIIAEMDGTNDTLAGLDLNAEVTTESANPEGVKWKDFYSKADPVTVRVQNVAPTILRPTEIEQQYTNMNASANTPYKIYYGASDVKADLEAGITVEIAVDGTTALSTKVTTATVQFYEVEFDGEGAHVVQITFTDKDGMPAYATMYYYVQQSKRLQLRAHGPAGALASSGGYSVKYAAAKGLGAGRVFAGENGPQKVVDFVHSYSFGIAESAVSAYAYGYKADASKPDDGSLAGRDIGLDKNGNWNKSLTITEYYNYALDNYTSGNPHRGVEGLDSFVYGWACNNSQSSSNSDSGTESFMLGIGEKSEQTIPLPDSEDNNSDSDKQQAIPMQYWEAVFSSEYLTGDNLGDINRDGIPDRYVLLYKFDVIDESGKLTGNDLRDLNFTADENPVPYCAEGDYLPSTERRVYSSLIPDLPESWLTDGEAFTPVLKIRGFPDSDLAGDGMAKPSSLNDAPYQIGFGRVSDQVYTNPKTDSKSTLSYVEYLAWCEYITAKYPDETDAHLNTAHFTEWTPENPTDPMKADTDGDGMTDGYEYWMWYMAHVGWVENFGTANEVHKRLTGRRYDPRNPGQGVLISADEIAKAFNPNSGAGNKTRDTDNDGLPDILEFEIGTNPVDFDTDGDGLPDGWELVIAGLDPRLSVSSANAPADGKRNFDGDAMAISSYQLEQSQQPVALDIEHAKRVTFAVVDPNGDSDGVQWYAMTEEPTLKAVQTLAAGAWWQVTVAGVKYAALAKPVFVDGRLAADTLVYTLGEYEPPAEDDDDDETGLLGDLTGEDEEEPEPAATEIVLGYPIRLPAGSLATVEGGEGELKQYAIDEAIPAAEANACWIYGRGAADASAGEVAETAADYGCLALARQLAVPSGAVICAFPSDERDVAFLHFLCYQEFGFDPRTAWNPNSPLADRWGKTVDGEALAGVTLSGQGQYTGIPSRTRAYTTYDEFLVSSFFYNNEGGWPSTKVPLTAKTATSLCQLWAGLTTNPQGPGEPDLITSSGEEGSGYLGRNSDQGADTDMDGVPDGWELYVMAGPKTDDGAYVFAPPYAGFKAAPGQNAMTESLFSPFVDSATSSDTANFVFTGVTAESKPMTEWRKYAGTDSCNYYSVAQSSDSVAYSTTIVRPEQDAQWLNKFFPSDPWQADTDGDGLSDGREGTSGSGGFVYGSPADDGKLTSIPGGGLNPLSVDTDRDGLPDGWETQFKGTPDSLYAGDGATYAKDADGNQIGNALQGLTDGMDGTVPDAFNYPRGKNGKYTAVSFCGYSVNQVVNRDYDHDGLDNWQEYLTGTMRCWRYDDPVSPLHGIPASAYYKADDEGKVSFNAEKAAEDLGLADVNEFWYKTLVDSSSPLFNPHLVTDTSSGAQYFTRVENVWDYSYIDKDITSGKRSGAYYWFYDRGNGQMLGNAWSQRWKDALGVEGYDSVPVKYASCSPIDPDSDHDGMDDYYELFHGLNPLLGQSGVVGQWWSVNSSGSKNDGEGFDIVYDSLNSLSGKNPQAWGEGDADASYKNFWQRLWDMRKASAADPEATDPWTGGLPRGTGFDFVYYPWLTGLATADADGDGTRNQEEAVMPMIAPTTAWHHTDPSALWLTDSSYSNSLVRTSYRLPVRTVNITLDGDGFTYGEKTYAFKDFDGFNEGEFIPFIPDSWNVATSQDDMNWIASFEENEGYDSDHDGLNDQDELGGKFSGKTDPLDADSPRRRQAMYFQGATRPSILQTMPFVREKHPDASEFNQYPDDLSFLQYTVECWVNPDTLDDGTIIERAMWTAESNPADKEFIRCNFQLAVKNGKWYTKFDPNDTTKAMVFAESDIPAVAGKWTHLAVSYDGADLRLYVDGVQHGLAQSGLQPAYGSSSVAVDGTAGVHAMPGLTYWRDREYKLHAIALGASFKTCRQGATDGSAFDITRGTGWDGYVNFFRGFVDEVRVWDGARSVTDIQNDRLTRYTSELAAANREAFFAEWSKTPAAGFYRGRYAKDGSGNPYVLPAELRFHWTFDSVFGGTGPDSVAKVPAGFDYAGEDGKGGRVALTSPDNYTIAWWQKVLAGYTETVYDSPSWIVWIPNTVTHLPRFDGTTLDSRYWSEDFAGAQNGTYKFARTAEPVSFWTQYTRNGIVEGEIAYSTSGSRSYFVSEFDQTNNTSLCSLYEFTGRHLNQTGDDMVALGGAYVKHCDNLWDDQGASSNWQVSGVDSNGDGLPDWWEEWANEHYRLGEDDITWSTEVVWPDQNGTRMTAGEAYLRDLARGYHLDESGQFIVTDDSEGDFRQRYDLDGNGLPDWWEELYKISGADIYADSDNDGLSNYVEYMLSEVFQFKGVRFSPVNAYSADPYTLDYFYRPAGSQLYVGEIFTDHDLVDDVWEGLYPQAFGSRLVYDAFADADEDGWSNRSENRYAKQCMPTIAEKQSHYTAADGLVADYPIPTIALTLNYNGINRTTVEKAPLIVQVTSGQLADGEVDAEFSLGAIEDVKASGGTADDKKIDTTINSYTRTIGKWSNRHAIGTLTPGYINKDSLTLEFCYDPSSQVYTWELNFGDDLTYWRVKRGTRREYDADLRKYGLDNVTLISKTTEYAELESMELRTTENSTVATWVHTTSGTTLGTVDLETGAFDLDLGVFAGQYVSNGTNENDYASLEDQTFRIAYSVNPSVNLPRKLYLGEADTGHVREGRNTIVAFADTNKDGSFTPGEPYGIVKDVNISWKGTSASIELTRTSPVTQRMKLWNANSSEAKDSGSKSAAASAAADRVRTIDDIYTELRESIYARNLTPTATAKAIENLNWMEFNRIETPTVEENKETRVRVVRWLVDKTPVWMCGVSPRVVFDKTFPSANAKTLTEDDILSSTDFDLDWQNLRSEVVNVDGVKAMELPVAEVDYLVVVGDGVTAFMGRYDTNNVIKAFSQVISRHYGTSRVVPQTVSPSAASGQLVRSASPTFVWNVDEDDVKGYTAFRLQVQDKSDAVVYDSGLRPVPPRNTAGNYVWTPPLFAGDRTTLGKVYANDAAYSWKVSMYNAKYTDDSYSSKSEYLQCTQTNGLEYGTANVAVRYFGPAKSFANKTVRVQAFTSPDFTGQPVAAGYVAAPGDADTGLAVTGKAIEANCRVIGLPAGSYYLQAFIDSNGNGTCEPWESMGYFSSRDGSTADWLNPVAMKFDGTAGKGDLAIIYIEDADTDNDSLPDAWEYAEYGSLTKKGIETASLTEAGELVVSKSLAGDLQMLPVNDVNAGLSGRIFRTMLSSASFAALATGADTASVEFAADGTLVAKPAVEEGTLTITGFTFDPVEQVVRLGVQAAVVQPTDALSESPFYTVTVQSGAYVTVKVLHTDTLAGEFVEVGRQEGVQIGGNGFTDGDIIVSIPEIDAKGGFFRVVVEQ